MSASETSSDNNIQYQNSRGENLLENNSGKKPQTTDTDYYFNMIANPSKIIPEVRKTSEDSELNDLLKDSDSSSSSIKSSSSSSSSSSRKSSSSSSSKSSSSRQKVDHIQYSPVKDQPIFAKPSSNSSYNAPQTDIKPVETTKPLTVQEIRMKKIELLRKLAEIKSKGYQLSKDYDFNSSLEEMEYEFDLLKSFADKRNSVKMAKGFILQSVSVMEFLNDKYDPFDFQLSGWGEHVSVEVDSWDDVLEELAEKYKGSGKKMAPEIKLLYLVIASASAFHFAKSQASKLPGLDSILASNPGLFNKLVNSGKTESSQFMTPQEINIEKQREELNKRDSDMKQQLMHQQMVKMQDDLRKKNELINSQQNLINKNAEIAKQTYVGLNPVLSSITEPQAANTKKLPPSIPANLLRPTVPEIRAPNAVKDILARLHEVPSQKPMNNDTQDETSSNNDRIISDSTLSESKRRGRKPKKGGINIF